MQMNTKMALVLACMIFVTLACSRAPESSQLREGWNAENDPMILQPDFVREFNALPSRGKIQKLPWSDSYWQDNRAGIAYRWRKAAKNNFKYHSPSADQVASMTLAQLADLSPAEKYDIFVGSYDYPTVQSERARTSPKAKLWEGLCHGWAPAALLYHEPHAVLVTSANGIKVPFGSSDVKALLSYHQGEVTEAPTIMLGSRCDMNLEKRGRYFASRHPECRGINAGAFHIVLANMVGLQREGLVVDLSHGQEIWNQPVYGYKTTVVKTSAPSPGADERTVSEVVVHTQVIYTDEIEPAWNALGRERGEANGKIEYNYRLELDSSGQIVGGQWLKFDRPDFLWVQEQPEFKGYYKSIKTLYTHALHDQVLPEP